MTPITTQGRVERAISDNDELGRLQVCLEVALTGRQWGHAHELVDQMMSLLGDIDHDIHSIESEPAQP